MTTMLQELSAPTGEIRVPSSLDFIAPTFVDGLIRVGKANDGGYVVPEWLITEADCLVSLGISEDWSFDQHFKKLNPQIRIHAYDHTLSKREISKSVAVALLKTCMGMSSLKKVNQRATLLRSYKAFFFGSVKHFEERVHSRADRPNDATLEKVFERTQSGRIFLKVDIEGSEYRIIDGIVCLADRIVGVAIEFHDTDPLRPVFVSSIRKLQERFEIVHFHANNFAGVAKDGFPEVVELTLIEKSRCPAGEKRTTFPIPQLDSPCNPCSPDYSGRFVLGYSSRTAHEADSQLPGISCDSAFRESSKGF
jgi:hypothetical protein